MPALNPVFVSVAFFFYDFQVRDLVNKNFVIHSFTIINSHQSIYKLCGVGCCFSLNLFCFSSQASSYFNSFIRFSTLSV